MVIGISGAGAAIVFLPFAGGEGYRAVGELVQPLAGGEGYRAVGELVQPLADLPAYDLITSA